MSRCQMRRDQWFFLILMTALVTRVLFFLVVSHPEARSGSFELSRGSDEGHYHLLALSVAESGRYRLSPDGPPTALRPPGTVLPIAVLYRIFGPRPFLGVVYVGLCALAIVWVAGALARHSSGDPRVERLAMLLAAVTPTLVFTASGIWSDTPTVLFTLLSLLLLLQARKRAGLGRLALAAACLGAAYLNRPSAAFAAPLITVWLLSENRPRRGLPRAASFAAVMALPIAAWGLWNAATLGGFYTGNTQSTVTLWQANNPVTAGLRPPALRHHNGFDLHREAEAGRFAGTWIPLRYIAAHDPWSDRVLPELEAEAWLRDQAVSFALENPGAFLRLLGYKALRILTAEPTAPSIIAESPAQHRLKWLMIFAERWFFIFAGGFGMVLFWRRRRSQAVYYLLFCAAGLVVAFIAYPNARILMPVTATLIVPAAMAVVWVWERFVKTPRSPRTLTSQPPLPEGEGETET